ncbi:MAG TPA: hypothetical protein VMV94_14455 [Phycisphaerae bacterium]|nr:hypothetical protein [Phycisphaerae bacterium]
MRAKHAPSFRPRALFVVSSTPCFALLAGCAATQPTRFSVSIEAWSLAKGYGYRYEVSPKSIQVTTLNDFGDEPRIVWQSPLTDEQSKSLTACLDRLPLGTLKERYDNPDVDDGLGLNFRIELAKTAKKTIEVHEIYQQDLAGLVHCINALVPEKYKIGYETRAQSP